MRIAIVLGGIALACSLAVLAQDSPPPEPPSQAPSTQDQDPVLAELRQWQAGLQRELTEMRRDVQGAPRELADPMRACINAKQNQLNAVNSKISAYESEDVSAFNAADTNLISARHELELATLDLNEAVTLYEIQESARQANLRAGVNEVVEELRGLYSEARRAREEIQELERLEVMLETKRVQLLHGFQQRLQQASAAAR